MTTIIDTVACLDRHLRDLHLPTIRAQYQEEARRAGQEGLAYEDYLRELVERECEVRQQNRVERLLRQSGLPLEKDLASFDFQRLPAKLLQQTKSLLDGAFVRRRENLLAVGKPGCGKTHLLCAIAQELVRRGFKVVSSTCDVWIQRLLIAKRDLKLEGLLKRLSRFDVLVIDEIGYVDQTREQMEVLFTLLAHRYERGSVLITSNLPFSKWDAIFKDPMTAAAAIDRLVHHSVILEMNLPSYRAEQAQKKKGGKTQESQG